ncbi:Schwann cell myelin protein-like isoform X1 [Ctenopharyngodon idella]|uniref:Schwann cell myelin protein-like isoform X1 n=1 Tax=Ctenopharyngodon idella TaxID=7959 RepID=UPI002230AEFC|nr:Schwann cell myelin protein-like isoform X1 [Ctenopharyngodon idella]XP_051720119.1 Schwann cell myelin protein-like isoform X1 [Ctenopharyngodon idella]
MMGPLIVHLLLQGVLLYDTLAWSVTMPKGIRGLRGSCLVIPCSFSYSSYPPENPRRVVWYQWVSKGYPLVYDPWYPNDVIDKFRWKTSLYGNPSNWDCSLLITNLEQSHDGEKLYTWIDPENVGWRTYKFYDVTSTIHVDNHPELPDINIYGGDKIGDTITVACSTLHSCPYSKPNIILNGIEGCDKINSKHIKDGLWKITRTCTSVVKAERLTIMCSVTHHGGITVTATKVKSAHCVHQKITIEPELTDFKEGVAKNFVCSVYHSCQKETPTITWNYENMQVLTGSKTLSGLGRITYSSITFLGSKQDHGKKLICTAKFSGGNTETSVVLHVQPSSQPPSINIYGGERIGDTITIVCSAVHSCPYSKPNIILKGIEGTDKIDNEQNNDGLWKIILTRTGVIKTESSTIECSVTHHGDITVTATKVKSAHCVHQKITIEPELTDFKEGVAKNFVCSVYHSCQKETPTITWNYENMQVSKGSKTLSGLDQVTYSSITFLGSKQDHGKKLICTAKFSGGNTETSVFLHVQRVMKYDVLGLEVRMPKDIHSLQGSCLVIPCSFSYTSNPPKDPRRVVWYQWVSKGYHLVYDPSHAGDVIEKFRGKTEIALLFLPDVRQVQPQMPLRGHVCLVARRARFIVWCSSSTASGDRPCP